MRYTPIVGDPEDMDVFVVAVWVVADISAKRFARLYHLFFGIVQYRIVGHVAHQIG